MRKYGYSLKWFVFIFFSVCVIAACKKDNPKPDGNSPSNTVNSSISFHHNVNQQPVEYDSIRYTNDFGNEFSIETIRYFISNVTFINNSGDSVLIADKIYIDSRESDYDKKEITQSIPNGNYSMLVFTFGLDSAMNQTGLFNNFPEAAMEWPIAMGGGYHYMKLEGKYKDQGNKTPFNFHTGPLNKNKNYFQIELPMNLTVSQGVFDIILSLEIQNWFKDPHSFDLTQISSGMMGEQTIQELVKDNGQDVFTIE